MFTWQKKNKFALPPHPAPDPHGYTVNIIKLFSLNNKSVFTHLQNICFPFQISSSMVTLKVYGSQSLVNGQNDEKISMN